jgi:hypothetical protein
VFAPESLLAMFAPLRLEGFSLVDDVGCYREPARIESAKILEYGCGMFEFARSA